MASLLFQRGVRPLLRDEPGPVVQGLVGRHPVLHSGGTAGSVVRRVRAADLRGRLLRLPEAPHRAPRQDQPDPQADPRPERLHAAHPW